MNTVGQIDASGTIMTIKEGGDIWTTDKTPLSFAEEIAVPPALSFHNVDDKGVWSEEVGKLTWDETGFHFTGDTDESAKIFFDYLQEQFDICKKGK